MGFIKEFYMPFQDNPLERIIAKELYDTVEKSNMVCIVHTNPILGEDEFQV